jgi:hypothetical protein
MPLGSSKQRGSSVESAVIDTEPALEFVGDSEATWHDARTVRCFGPRPDRPFLGIPVLLASCYLPFVFGARLLTAARSPEELYHKRHEQIGEGEYLLPQEPNHEQRGPAGRTRSPA